MSIADLIRKPSSGGFATATVATGATHPAFAWAQPGIEGRTVATVASVAVATPRNAETATVANDAAIHHRWLVTQPDSEVFSLSRTPPATLAEIQRDYPGAQVEPEPELPPGPPLHPEDLVLAYAYLRHIDETDQAIGQAWIDGLAADPERLKLMHAEVVRLGLATFDPAPEHHVEDASAKAVCALCGHWTPSPVNSEGGMGRCLVGAPASRKAGSLWPWTDALVRCTEFDPAPAAPETTTTEGPTQ